MGMRPRCVVPVANWEHLLMELNFLQPKPRSLHRQDNRHMRNAMHDQTPTSPHMRKPRRSRSQGHRQLAKKTAKAQHDGKVSKAHFLKAKWAPFPTLRASPFSVFPF